MPLPPRHKPQPRGQRVVRVGALEMTLEDLVREVGIKTALLIGEYHMKFHAPLHLKIWRKIIRPLLERCGLPPAKPLRKQMEEAQDTVLTQQAAEESEVVEDEPKPSLIIRP